MMKIDFVDFNSAQSSSTPAHLRIVDVIEGLFRALEQNHWSTETPRREALRPVGLLPVGSWGLVPQQSLNFISGDAFIRSELLFKTLSFHFLQPLAVIVDLPQPAILAVLQDPSIEDRKQCNLLFLRFQAANNLLRNVGSIAEPTKAI